MFFLLLFVVWKADGVLFFGGLELSRSVERLTAHFELFFVFSLYCWSGHYITS